MSDHLKRYIIVFFLTLGIFLFAFLLSSFFGDRKIDQLRQIQEQIALDILSTETRYSLLERTSCVHAVAGSEIERGLSRELADLARRLKFTESQFGSNNENVIFLKKYYALLQIKDYLLIQELSERCGEQVFVILYFHEQNCPECQKQSLVLDELVKRYSGVRVYWFEKDIITPAQQTLLSIFDISQGPTLVIGNNSYQGFLSLEDIQLIAPDIFLEPDSVTDELLNENND